MDEDAYKDQCKGMAEYRLGHYEEAIKWLLKGAEGTKRASWCRPESELWKLYRSQARLRTRDTS